MNPYEILQVDKRASIDVIKAAYRTLQKLHSKDEAKAKLLNQARSILFDSTEREKFDNKKHHKPKTIGDYTLIKQLAEGGFGITYQAEHTRLKTPVCIKHAKNVSAMDEELLLEEAKSIWDLRHYSIPAIRDIVKLPDDSLALVMSYIPGPTLAEVVEKHHGKHRKALDPEHVAWITSRVLNVLKYLHYNGVVHGDIKPQNIIIQPESHTVVVVDFGLSLIRPKSTSINKGYTPIFAAPEQMESKPLLPETDFYGLGMTMIYALGGDVEHRRVPSNTPDTMCEFIKSLIPLHLLSRPSWEKTDLCEHFEKVRNSSFGRTYSGMKKMDI